MTPLSEEQAKQFWRARGHEADFRRHDVWRFTRMLPMRPPSGDDASRPARLSPVPVVEFKLERGRIDGTAVRRVVCINPPVPVTEWEQDWGLGDT